MSQRKFKIPLLDMKPARGPQTMFLLTKIVVEIKVIRSTSVTDLGLLAQLAAYLGSPVRRGLSLHWWHWQPRGMKLNLNFANNIC